MYGDGSDGALSVTSGTHNLELNRKYQFTTVSVSAGATLSTNSTTGSVLYILATDWVMIEGDINLSNIVNHGRNTWSVTIDGQTFTSPGVANGGAGGSHINSAAGGSQSSGFGGGGAGGAFSGIGNTARGGSGGSGGANPGNGGSSVTVSRGSQKNGNNGGTSAGGSGASLSLSGSATSGAGGNAYGSNGGNASNQNDSRISGGGGGAGGRAGRAGVHLVIKSPFISINGSIILSGTNGQNGGAGGTSTYWQSSQPTVRGSGGGGGGGGNGGNLYLSYTSLVETPVAINLNGGTRGSGGAGYRSGGAGTNGTAGQVFKNSVTPGPTPLPPEPYDGPFVRVYKDGSWKYVKANIYSVNRFAEGKTRVL